jgi:hypothetical protein
MPGKVALRVALMAAALGFVMIGATSPGPLVAQAEAGAKAKPMGTAKPKAHEQRALRHKEHVLERRIRHDVRNAERAERQLKHDKRKSHPAKHKKK